MPITPDEIMDWVDEYSPLCKNEVDYRNVTGRAYYSAYHSCLITLPNEPLPKEETKGGIHIRYVKSLLADPNKNIRSVGRTLQVILNNRSLADYDIHKNFTQHTMGMTVLAAKKINEKLAKISTTK